MGVPLALLAGPILAGAAELGKAAINAVPTATDRLNRQRLRELKRREAAGNLGLEDRERQLLNTALMDPVRRQQAEATKRQAAMLSAGGMRSGAAVQGIRDASNRELARSGQEAANRIAQANDAKIRAQRQEIEERTAAKSQRSRDVAHGFFEPLAEMAGAFGAGGGETPEFWRAAGFAGAAPRADERVAMSEKLNQLGLPPNLVERILEDYSPRQIAAALQQMGG